MRAPEAEPRTASVRAMRKHARIARRGAAWHGGGGWGGAGGGGRFKTPIGSAIVAMAAAIVTIANVVMAAVVEPQQSWS